MRKIAPARLLPMLAALLIALGTAAGPARAQTYPDHVTDTVNDFADLLDDEAEARITDELVSLREDIGVEMTVVTIKALADYDAGDIEDFATGLFNSWGVGDASRNDGIMILVSETDREMRLVLGAGYPSTYDWLAEDVVDLTMLPRFRDGDLQGGIEAGVKDAISRIAEPFSEGRPPEEKPATGAAPQPSELVEGGESSGGGWAGIGIGAVFVALIGALFAKGPIGRMMLARKPCPKCGAKGHLSRHSETLSRATTTSTGTVRAVTECSACGWHDETTRTLPRIRKSSSSSGGSFGGGKSSGGGASGKW
ncbi:TPM domain-containing protein [Frigidibacter sp. ROC022]|uniref:TPM domain-containing protein n=1 Tax=Frigidibacter sp. ROC022 TaxID=2971796 RepID=UPI00215A8DDB|nr:TPM domain-containing protein [Frigidibacter sp. ROC022]MCR8723252.1 TPM domain-containing protein [Frigidibacter sp. ROC022]